MNKVVFFGTGYYTIPVVERLKDLGLAMVVTIESEGQLISYLKQEKIPFLVSKLKSPEDIQIIENLKPDIGALASYGAILPKKILDLFPKGILNIHPSLLPQYKGPSPIQYTILDGVQHTGVSIIKLDDQVDHGPIVMQKPTRLSSKATLQEATELMFSQGADMMQEVIQKIQEGKEIQEIPQDIKNESWTEKVEKINGEVILDNPPKPFELDRMIRAFYPWPGVYLTVSLSGKDKILKLLPNDMYQIEGKRPVNYKDFLNGYGNDAAYILAKLGR